MSPTSCSCRRSLFSHYRSRPFSFSLQPKGLMGSRVFSVPPGGHHVMGSQASTPPTLLSAGSTQSPLPSIPFTQVDPPLLPVTSPQSLLCSLVQATRSLLVSSGISPPGSCHLLHLQATLGPTRLEAGCPLLGPIPASYELKTRYISL